VCDVEGEGDYGTREDVFTTGGWLLFIYVFTAVVFRETILRLGPRLWVAVWAGLCVFAGVSTRAILREEGVRHLALAAAAGLACGVAALVALGPLDRALVEFAGGFVCW
jgi:hypothetical protein